MKSQNASTNAWGFSLTNPNDYTYSASHQRNNHRHTYQRNHYHTHLQQRSRQPNRRLFIIPVSTKLGVAARRHPQNVRLITMLFGPNFEAKSQSVLGKSAKGVPQVDVSMWVGAFRTSSGTTSSSERDQNQALILVSVRSVTYLGYYACYMERKNMLVRADSPSTTIGIESTSKAVRLVCLHATPGIVIDISIAVGSHSVAVVSNQYDTYNSTIQVKPTLFEWYSMEWYTQLTCEGWLGLGNCR